VNRFLTARVLLVFALAATSLPYPSNPALAAAAPVIVLTPTAAPPGTTVTVTGSQFGISEAVDIYFDTAEQALTTTDAAGAFSASITIPANASYETHWITAVGRHSGLAAQTPLLVSSNWAQFRRGVYHQGYDQHETRLAPNTVGGLRLDWSFTIGSSVDASPSVANGVTYIQSDYGFLYALNASTGALIWSYATGGSASTAAVANGVVYVGSNSGTMYALNASTGALMWSFTTGSYIESSPAVVNGVVFFGSYDDKFYALDAYTGALRWTKVIGDNQAEQSSAAVANGIVYVGSYNGSIYALRASTGAVVWNHPTGYPVVSSPAIASGVLYVGSGYNNGDGKVVALSASTGRLLWRHGTGGYVTSSPALANGIVYVGCQDGKLYALRAASGTLVWSHETPEGYAGSSPAVANGVVYFEDGHLDALSASSGLVLWSDSVTDVETYSSPTIANGVVYLGSADGPVLAFDLPGPIRARTRPVPGVLVPKG